jgi:hypothetical protein
MDDRTDPKIREREPVAHVLGIGPMSKTSRLCKPYASMTISSHVYSQEINLNMAHIKKPRETLEENMTDRKCIKPVGPQ